MNLVLPSDYLQNTKLHKNTEFHINILLHKSQMKLKHYLIQLLDETNQMMFRCWMNLGEFSSIVYL